MTDDLNTLSEVIEGVVRERFGDGVIEAVRTKEAVDFDGDGIFVVDVIFNDKVDLDGEKASSVVRFIRQALRGRGEDRFPVISFISEIDAASRDAEAA